MSVMPGPEKNGRQQKFKLFKSRKESMTVHTELEAKRERVFQIRSIRATLISEQFQTLRESSRAKHFELQSWKE